MQFQVIGVAFQSMVGVENIGFIIPVPIIKHFLNDIELHGHYTGFGALGIQCQAMDNPQLRKFHKMAHDMVGRHAASIIAFLQPFSLTFLFC